MSGGSLCAGTCRLTNGSSAPIAGSVVVAVTRLPHRSEPSASQISHRYAQASRAANTWQRHSSSPPTVDAIPSPLVNIQSSTNPR